ncbi:MAG: hypothetical protein LJD31_04865 [Wolbachia endosymbiont of Menacanthus eurysternus]|nr:hypothetical protein [Wolbachia endosymbiont of Menacanthus eurysternus]
MIIKHSDGREETHTIFTCAILSKDYMTIRKVLKVSGEHSILRDILNKKITIKHGDGQIATYTPLVYAKLCEDREAEDEILKIARDKKILEDILNENQNEQPLLLNVVEETAMREPIEEVLEECKESLEVKEQKDIFHTEATETDIQSCEDINKDSEDFQPIFKSSEEVQNTSIDTTAQEPNTPESLPPSEPCFDNDTAEGKSSKRAYQPVVAGFVGTALLVSSVALCIIEMHIVAVVGGIVGLVCMGFALYNAIKPNTKFEKIEDMKQLTAQPCLNPE